MVVSSRRGPAWLLDVIQGLKASGDLQVVAVLAPGTQETARATRAVRALLSVYCRIDDRLFGGADDPSRTVDLGISPAEATTRDVLGPEAPDLVLRLDGEQDHLPQWPDPKLGTWALVHGCGFEAQARPDLLVLPPGGAEMIFGERVTISRLVALSEVDRRVIGQVVSKVDRLSMRRGTRGHVCKLAPLITQRVIKAAATGQVPDPIGRQPDSDPPSDVHRRVDAVQVAWGLARIVLGYGVRLARRRLTPERWVVAVSRDARDPRQDGTTSRFRFLAAPAGREWADPFPVRMKDEDVLFLEEYVRPNRRGRLAVVHLDDSPRGWRSVDTIMDLPTHLSYPFVFEWAGDRYLLPEQAGTGSLQLYVAEDFPLSWRWHSTALDLPAADATLAEIDGRWWMFAAITPPGGLLADELHLFHADAPIGPWTAHRQNPVLSDVRSARPAGRVYRRGDDWYRPAQDGSLSYGHSIALARIDRIDLDGYRETVVDVIEPNWAPNLIATHTLNSDDGLTAVDALRPELLGRL